MEKPEIFIEVCTGPSCSKFFPEDMFRQFKTLAEGKENARVVKCGCTGNCDFSPNIKINGEVRTTVQREEVEGIFGSLINQGQETRD